MISKEKINGFLKNKFDITVFDSLPSTNDYAKNAARSNAKEGTVIISRSQSSGKGRLGRSFFSPDATGIYLSLVLTPDLPADSALPITACAAVCAARAVESVCGVKTEIKWVNDIYLDGKKVCGILTEGQINPENGKLSFAVLGIGINVYPPKDGFPAEISDIAGSILPYSDDAEIPNRIIAEFLDTFICEYRNLESKSFLDEYRNRSCLLGKNVRVTNTDTVGTAVGIDENFNLILLLPDGTALSLSSGEVSVREV